VSLVEVSPSIEMLLKDLSIAAVRRDCRGAGAMGASVQTIPRRVAMFGWIMPAPLVIPARWYVVLGEEGSVKERESNLGNVSVVQIARAVASQWSWVEPRDAYAEGILEVIFWMGNLLTHQHSNTPTHSSNASLP